MSKLKKQLFIITILVLNLILLINSNVFAVNTAELLERIEYSEKFKEWIKLPKEEREKVIMPLPYEPKRISGIYQNPLYTATIVKASLDERYSLKDVIPENLIIKNQMDTGSCWAFTGISSLETNIALYNHKNGLKTKTYDFSERHMEYASSRIFANGEINPMGYNRAVGSGGNFPMVESYLINGNGAINEADMPFENNENTIDISGIQGKKVTSQVYDTSEFNDYNKKTGAERTTMMNEIKQHIQNYGSVYSSIHGGSSASEENCYNNTTGAKYCSDSTTHRTDHAVSIIGWDDNYSIDNFINGSKPTSKGAWIVRNSWGEKSEYVLSELKAMIFKAYREQCIARGWNSAEEIPDSFIESAGYTIKDGMAYMPVGDNGLIYVSYEDANISSGLWGIEKATDATNYDNIYQYDEFYPIDYVQVNSSDVIICNIFNKKTDGKEYLNQVGLNLIETSICKVYINANGSSTARKDLKEVPLKAGESETLNPGYHTLEFAKPVEINAPSFVVAIEIKVKGDNTIVLLETKSEYTQSWDCVTVESEKCFVSAVESAVEYDWVDLSKLSQINNTLRNGDGTIKAFTTNELYDESLKNIEITTPPNKTTYMVGENFDKTGMVVKANYNSRTNPSAILDDSSYSITDGTNLAEGQTSVTITYGGQSVKQAITVQKESVTEITIKTPPNKTEYKEGKHFDKAGMVVEATYQSGAKGEVTGYKILDGYNLKGNQTKVTIEYEGKTAEQPVTVTPNPLTKIDVTQPPNKVKYIVGQNFDKTGMIITGTFEDEDTEVIMEYKITNGTGLVSGQTLVTIEYEGETTNQEITVEDKKVTNISISKMPTKLKYIQNKEQLDLTGGTIKASYNDGSNEEVSLKSEQVKTTGFNNKNIGKNTITVTYLGQTTTFDVEILAEEIVKNSNFDNANCVATSMKYYTFSNKSTKEYFIVDSLVKGMVKATGNDSYEYFYYLSPNQNENNIQDWVKIKEEQAANDKLQFVINTKDVKNYAQITNNEATYIYIKEVVKKGGNQSVVISKAMKIGTDGVTPEVYLDNVKQGNERPPNNPEKPNNGGDNTISTTIIPNAGTIGIFVVITIVSVIGIVGYIRYKNLSKYVE